MNVIEEKGANWKRGSSRITHVSGKWELSLTPDGRGGHLYQKRGGSWYYIETLTYESAIKHVNANQEVGTDGR